MTTSKKVTNKKTTSAQANNDALRAKIAASFDVRIASASNENQRDFMLKMQKRFAFSDSQIAKAQALNIDLVAIAKRIEQHDKKSADFVAQYVIEKIAKAISAFSSESAAFFDKYSFSIIKNLVKLQALDNLNTQRAICSKIELDALAQEQTIRVYHDCNVSTASTQSSSTRLMLQILNVCNVSKGAKADSISFTDSESAKLTQQLFA